MLSRRTVVGGLLASSGTVLAGCGGASRKVAEGALVDDEGTPVAAELLKEGPLGDKALGSPNAPVTIVEYASLTCPFCHKFHTTTYPRLKKEYIDTGKVRYIVREFPIGRSAAAAAVVTRCAPESQYFTLFDKFLVNQRHWTGQKVRPDAIYKVAAQTGMSRQTFDKCMANQTIIDGLVWVKQRGRQFGVSGTPTFFINQKKVRGALTFDQIKAMVDPHIT